MKKVYTSYLHPLAAASPTILNASLIPGFTRSSRVIDCGLQVIPGFVCQRTSRCFRSITVYCAVYGVGLQLIVCWECEFKSRGRVDVFIL